jgi:hypothetical protein
MGASSSRRHLDEPPSSVAAVPRLWGISTTSRNPPPAIRWLARAQGLLPLLLMRLPRWFVVLPGIALAACAADTADDPTERVTWYQDVAPIMAKHCMSCHQSGGIGPFALTDYESVRDHATLALAAIDQGVMPPFDAREEPDCTPRYGWVDDPRLGDDEKETLREWTRTGFAPGAPADVPEPPRTDLPGVTQTLQPAMPFVTQGNRDQFICTVLDPQATRLTWMTGLQVRPGNPKVVHHAVLFEVQPGPELTALLAERQVGVPFDCDQMPTPGQFVISIWTPGNQPMQTPPELAVPIVAGAKIVMQLHYHPAGIVNEPDLTSVDLRLSSTAPSKMYFITAIGNEAAAPNLLPDPDDIGPPQFLIPRNRPDHVERMRRTITSLGDFTDVRIYSANPHMHYVGTHISSRIERPAARGGEPQTECLANGGWNFDWQRTYIYDAPLDRLPSIQVGDTIEVSCRWNNTLDNPFVQRMLSDSSLPPQPIDIALGEQTTNEMCLEIFGLAVALPAQLTDNPSGADLQLPPLTLLQQR